MALEVSNFEKALLANSVFGGAAYAPAGTFTLKLFVDTVDLDGVGDECDAAGYAPKDITNNLTNFPSTTTGIKALAVAHAFDPVTADTDPIVSCGLFDEDGELRYREVFDTPFVIENGQFYNLAIGDLTFQIS